MGTRLELPDGQWADLLEPRKVSERKRRPITRLLLALASDGGMTNLIGDAELAEAIGDESSEAAAAIAAKIAPDTLGAMDDLNDALVVALVDAWSYDMPVNADSVADLPGDAYEALRDACAPFLSDLMPNFGPTPDPDSPTSPSSV